MPLRSADTAAFAAHHHFQQPLLDLVAQGGQGGGPVLGYCQEALAVGAEQLDDLGGGGRVVPSRKPRVCFKSW